ncbi:MAG: DMT family transporter [Candidatus Ornithomonoglobus sp.]
MIKSDKAKGALCIIASAFCFALMNMFVRLAGDLPSIEKSFFRNIVAAVIAAVTLIKNRESFIWQKGNLPGLIARSVFGTMGILCNFYAIDHLVLADASMLNKLSPFFAVIFSFLILKERVTLFQGAMVITAFIGSLFIIKPTPGLLNPASLVGLCGGLGAGIAYTMVRKLTEKGERKTYIVFFFSAFSCILTMPYLIFDFHPMTWQQLLILICAGISAAGGQFTITAAYSYAPAREISVFDYTQIIFAAGLGFFVFGQIPDWLSIIGYVIICGVSLTMFLQNKNVHG